MKQSSATAHRGPEAGTAQLRDLQRGLHRRVDRAGRGHLVLSELIALGLIGGHDARHLYPRSASTRPVAPEVPLVVAGRGRRRHPGRGDAPARAGNSVAGGPHHPGESHAIRSRRRRERRSRRRLDGFGHRRAGNSTDVRDVIDQGDVWTFRFTSQGYDAGQVQITKADLKRSDWRVVIPAAVGERLAGQGATPTPPPGF